MDTTRLAEIPHQSLPLDVCPLRPVRCAYALTVHVAAPLPKFEGLTPPSAPPAAPGFSPQPTGSLQPQVSGSGPIRVPPLVPGKAAEYAGLFEKSGAVNGILSGTLLFHVRGRLGLANKKPQARMQKRYLKRHGYQMKSSAGYGIFQTRSSVERSTLPSSSSPCTCSPHTAQET